MPKSPNPDAPRPGSIGSPIDPFLERYEDAWNSGQPPDIDVYLCAAGALRLPLLRELVHIDLERRIKNGEPARVETYLKRYPELAKETDQVASLVLAEFNQRRNREPRLADDEFLRRFPKHHTALLASIPSPGAIAMIAFACSCGQKFKIKPEYAGRKSVCPTCKQPVVVPALDATQAHVPQGAIDGTPSSLDQAGVHVDVTLERRDTKLPAGQESVQKLLNRGKKGQRYVIEKEIARGGMGAVLRAVDCDIRREVAIKFMLNQADPKAKARFIEEAQITGQLEHPNIPPVHEIGVDPKGGLFFAMKMVKGRSLAQVLTQLREQPRSAEKDWPLGRLLNVIVNICNALAYAHSCNVVHRDLKPANIMVGDFGEVYVMDWGLAKVLTSRDRQGAVEPAALPDGRGSSHQSKVVVSREPDIDMTQQGSVLGTPVYMPPEQATGQIAEIDQRSDIYSLGAILYEMLTLLPPVEKDGGHLAVLVRVAQGEIIPPEQRISSMPRKQVPPKELSAIAMKALSKEKANRYPSAEAFRKDIERFVEGRSVSAKEDTKREMIWKFVKRNKGFSTGMAATFVVLVCSLFFVGKAWLDMRKAETARLKQGRDSVPSFVLAGRMMVNEKLFGDALAQANTAIGFNPDHADARLLRGQLWIGEQKYAEARQDLEACLRSRGDDAAARKLLELCKGANPDDSTRLLALADELSRQKLYAISDRCAQQAAKLDAAKQALLASYQKRIEAVWPGEGRRLSLDDKGKFVLGFNGIGEKVKELSPLGGMPLSRLDLGGCREVRDLSPLKGMPLTSLSLDHCGQVRDLSPLKGMPLTSLSFHDCGQIRDLSPLKGMPLTWLKLSASREVGDLSPLKGMPLTGLDLAGCGQVGDLSPLKGMPLKSLQLGGCGQVGDLSPLKGMPLTFLSLGGCQVRDLSPLKGMPLTNLSLNSCGQVGDLSPLKGMPLTSLTLDGCGQVRDLSPLEGVKLSEIVLPPEVSKGMSVLRRMKTLGKINRMPAADFWKQYDAGKFPQYKD